MNRTKTLIATITIAVFLLPSVSFASTLTQPQIDAVIGLLRAFSVEQSVIALIQTELGPQIATLTPNNIAPVSSSSSSTSNSMILSLSVNQPIVSADSIRLSWNTNIPANSKVFITPVPVASNASQTQVFQSISGYSTQGFVTIPNLTSSTQYSYTIEAISDAQDQQLTGLITTGIAPIIAPTATITSPDSLTAPITISGTTSLPTGSRIYISVRNTSGYTIASYTTVTNGTWSIPFGTGFPSGSYSITVRSNSSTGTILTTGTLPVTVTKSSKYSGGTMP